MKPNLGIPENHLQEISYELNKLLANETVLYTKTRNYHWNVTGDNFMEMHKFYETQYTELEEIIDEVAERIRTLGHFAHGRLSDYLKTTSLVEQEYTTNQNEQLQNLLNDHETIIRHLRDHVNDFADRRDYGTSDFITGIMEQHEKMAWMIRSYLQ